MNQFSKESGVLLHLTSLPGPHGIGDLGQAAVTFIDQLERMGQKLWQILPSGQTDNCNSPYSTISAFANNPLWINLNQLVDSGFIQRSEIEHCPDFPFDKVDYKSVKKYKEPLIRLAADRFMIKASEKEQDAFQNFCKKNAYWLDDFTLFMVLWELHDGQNWSDWPSKYALRENKALNEFMQDYHQKIHQIKILQYFFYKQWHWLKLNAADKGIKIIGDIPIYISYNSADVWANRHLFKLDENGRMVVQSGCPPDYFIAEGQAWNHPIYDWDIHKETGFKWWLARMKYLSEMVDIIRIDHFNGFAKYWEVPAIQKNGKNGNWVTGPGISFMNAVYNKLGDQPIFAEDLGAANQEAAIIREKFGIPGISVLQTTFSDEELPEKIVENTIVYTGTHDNDTIKGWFDKIKSNGSSNLITPEMNKECERALAFFNSDGSEIHWDFIKMALNSQARTVITPLQDILGLGTESRMNVPGTIGNNWVWRYPKELMTYDAMAFMRTITASSGRI